MTIRNILIPLAGVTSDQSALETGLLIARQFDGHLDILHVSPNPASQMPLLDESTSGQRVQQMLKHFQAAIETRTNKARSQFDAFLAENQIRLCETPQNLDGPSASLQFATGVEAIELARIAGAYDLVVVNLALARTRDKSREALEELLFSTGRPVLLAPQERPNDLGDTILLGWNRTAQSARTVHSAMPFLEGAKRVIVLMVATGAKQGPSPQDVARTLAWHDIEAEIKEIEPDARSVGRVLLDEADVEDADLLVMGAYSHSRWREKILGGVTKYVIDNTERPVFLAH